MESQYLLSICIPTYNRAPYLKKCLDSLVCQPEFLKGDVEIVISDNASTDDTCTLVTGYQRRYSNITYHRNDHNIGYINGDINYAIAMQSGHGLLRKLGGDTRIYKRGSLKYFCKAAIKYRREKPIMYFSNGQNSQRLKDETIISSTESFLRAVSFGITWQDTFFLWDSECGKLVDYASKSTSGFWFIEKNIELMQKKQLSVFFTQNVIGGSKVKKKDISYGVFDVFYNNFLGIFRPLVVKQIITQDCFDYLEKDLLFGFFLNSILEWELRNDRYIFSEKENLKEAVLNQYRGKPYFKDVPWEYKKAKLKWRLKEIPVLGMLLVELKHKIQRR